MDLFDFTGIPIISVATADLSQYFWLFLLMLGVAFLVSLWVIRLHFTRFNYVMESEKKKANFFIFLFVGVSIALLAVSAIFYYLFLNSL